jgi:ABC-type polysaccharide/polyol phosphate export permease
LVIVPLFVLGLLSLAVGYLLSPLAVLLPDITNAWSVVLRVGWFVSPGLYGFDQVPQQYRTLYMAVNPMVGIIEGIRRPIHDGLPPLWDALAWSALWALVLLLLGRLLFKLSVNRCVRLL